MPMLDIDSYKKKMDEVGIVILESVVPVKLVKKMREDIYKAYEVCRKIQVKNGIADNNEYTAHHLIGVKDSFMDYLLWSEVLEPYFAEYFGGKYILNSFGGAINRAHSKSYAHYVHRDVRSYSPDLPLIINTLVMLDDFTEHNGATYLMPGSHRTHPEKPTDKEFFAKAIRALAPAGSILMFDSNIWHSGGENTTDNDRCSVTPMYCQPFVKPQFDYPRVLGYDKGDKYSAFMRQIIGYNSRIPATLDEWYQPPEKRMYKPGQG